MEQFYHGYRTCVIILLSSLFIQTAAAQPCTLSVSVQTSGSRCKATGSITVTASNGSGNYNYIVSSTNYNTSTSSNIIDGLSPGSYSVKVKDLSSSCTVQQDNIIIGGNYQDPRFTLLATDISCTNASDGSITVANLQYGTSPFTFTIVSPSTYGTGTSNTSGYFNNLPAGDYFLRLVDSCGGIQTRAITIASYNWTPIISAITKAGCDSIDVTLSVSDNKGNNNTGSAIFNNFMYGASIIPGDTTWSANPSFRFYKGNQRAATLIVKDGCGNSQYINYYDNDRPAVNATVQTSNYQCNDFMATVTGQQHLTNPQYCLYNNANVLLSCNGTGVFNNLPYGTYCINITDACYDTTFTRCFTATKPVAAVAAAVGISNLACLDFTATVSGQQNLSSPQYCLYDSINNLLTCNTTGVFTNTGYGPHCITITDGCSGTVITRCFTQRKPVPLVSVVNFSNLGCNTFTAAINGGSNLTNPQYCLYDDQGNIIICNATGIFNNLAYGTYCMHIQNDPACYDTLIQRCFTVAAPVPSVGSVAISNKTCTGFTATITGQTNLTNPYYYLYDSSNVKIDSNGTGKFVNLPYGSYCIQMQNDGSCYDTTIQRCFSTTTPVPAVGASVTISNKACSGFSAAVTGQANLTNPYFYLLDNSNTAIDSNSTGTFNNIAYGSYCIMVVNTCYDTSINRCFSVSATPVTIGVNSVASCSLGKTNLSVNISNGTAPYTIRVYNPWGVLVNTTNSPAAVTAINGLAGLPAGYNYKIFVSGACGGNDSATVTPLVYTVNKSINANSKCPGGVWQNGTGDVIVNAQFSGGAITPSIISKDGNAVNIPFTTQAASNYTFDNMQPATYVIQYTLQNCGTIVYDTFNLRPYTYPDLKQSAVYQCNNNNFSVSAAVSGGISPYTYEIIGSIPSSPGILQAPQAASTFAISNGTTYSLVRLRVTDACGNATINDASILPLANTIVSASSDCIYNDITLSVDSIPNATYSWYKKTSNTDSTLISSSQTYTIMNLLPPDTGTYVSVVSVNSGCLTRTTSYRITGACGGSLLSANTLVFTAAAEKEMVRLTWTTDVLFDAKSFVIEHSTDGTNYTAIGQIMATHSNSNKQSQYVFADLHAVQGVNYYRLRVIKTSNNFAYSEIKTISKAGAAVAVSVMPNPVVNAFSIQFGNDKIARYTVSLLGADGKMLVNNMYTVNPGEAKTMQRPGATAAGMYFLVIVNNGNNKKDIIKLYFN